MGKITTRIPDSSAMLQLKAMLHDITEGAIGNDLSERSAGNSLEEVLSTIQSLLVGSRQAISTLMMDVQSLIIENASLGIRLEESLDIIENFSDVSFDDALDNATEDLMCALCAAGTADITADGELAWDERALMSKADLKPVLREAIESWVDQKLG